MNTEFRDQLTQGAIARREIDELEELGTPTRIIISEERERTQMLACGTNCTDTEECIIEKAWPSVRSC